MKVYFCLLINNNSSIFDFKLFPTLSVVKYDIIKTSLHRILSSYIIMVMSMMCYLEPQYPIFKVQCVITVQ